MSEFDREKIFVTLRKFDVKWQIDPTKTFCQVYKELNPENKDLSDKEIEKLLKDIDIK